jgi:hypothetical protein
MAATQLTNRRNRNGVKASCDQYRHFNGNLYIAWLIYVTPERVAAYRAAGIRCRRVKGELYIHDDDRKLARDTDAAHNFN